MTQISLPICIHPHGDKSQFLFRVTMRFLTNERRYLLLQKDPLQPVNVVALLELESPHVFYIHTCMCIYIHTHTHIGTRTKEGSRYEWRRSGLMRGSSAPKCRGRLGSRTGSGHDLFIWWVWPEPDSQEKRMALQWFLSFFLYLLLGQLVNYKSLIFFNRYTNNS